MGNCCEHDLSKQNLRYINRLNLSNNTSQRDDFLKNNLRASQENPILSHIKVIADNQDIQYPIWIQANNQIYFKIEGEWGIFASEKNVNYRGIENIEQRNMNWPLGCLIGFISGYDHYIKIEEDKKYIFQNSGCLYLSQNSGEYATFPVGYLDVIVIGGVELSIPEVEEKQGWNFYQLYTCDPDHEYHDYKEQNLIYNINKFRHNSSLYAYLYFKPKIQNDPKKLIIYNYLCDIKESLLPLEPMLDLQKIAYSINSNLDNFILQSREGRNQYVRDILLKNDINSRIYGEQICFQYSQGINILSALLFNTSTMEYREIEKTILNSKFNKIGISITQHHKYDWSSVICLAQI